MVEFESCKFEYKNCMNDTVEWRVIVAEKR